MHENVSVRFWKAAVAHFSPNRNWCIDKNLLLRFSERGEEVKNQQLQFVQTKDFKIVFLYYPDYQMIW